MDFMCSGINEGKTIFIKLETLKPTVISKAEEIIMGESRLTFSEKELIKFLVKHYNLLLC